jgi:hypothetical protein
MPAGRPTVLTKANISLIAEALLYGLSDEEIGLLSGMSYKTVSKVRAGQLVPEIKKAEVGRKMMYIRRITEGKRADWARWAWFLERRFPKEFSKPEIQLSLQQNYNVSALSINITSVEAKEIAAQALPEQLKVKEMFAQYRPALPEAGNGDGAH